MLQCGRALHLSSLLDRGGYPRRPPSRERRLDGSFEGFFPGHDSTRGSGVEVFKISRVEPGGIRRSSSLTGIRPNLVLPRARRRKLSRR